MLTVVKCLNYYRFLLFSSCSFCLCRQLPHAPENLIATLSSSERRTINLTWAQAFDGNSPLIRYILEVSENSEFSGLLYFSVTLHSALESILNVSVCDRRTLDCALGQHRSRSLQRDRGGPHPSTFLPVPPVCRQRRGEGPVQQGDSAVSLGRIFLSSQLSLKLRTSNCEIQC